MNLKKEKAKAPPAEAKGEGRVKSTFNRGQVGKS